MAAPTHPLFTRTIGPGSRLAIWTAISVLVIILDSRFNSLSLLRSGLASLLLPVQAAVRIPVELSSEVSGYLVRHRVMQKDNQALVSQHVQDMAQLHRLTDLESENAQLRSLLNFRARVKNNAVAAEIWSISRDPFSRRALLDKGVDAGVAAGQAVVDAQGLLGQVARTYPFSSEVLMVTDPDQVVPAYVQRTGQRVLVFGTGYGLEIRYQPSTADIRRDGVLLTSGIDHVYPEGLPLARVSNVVRPSSNPYAKVYCVPIANVGGSRMLMVLLKPVGTEQKR
jgi:rod shape-determining protein MreC